MMTLHGTMCTEQYIRTLDAGRGHNCEDFPGVHARRKLRIIKNGSKGGMVLRKDRTGA